MHRTLTRQQLSVHAQHLSLHLVGVRNHAAAVIRGCARHRTNRAANIPAGQRLSRRHLHRSLLGGAQLHHIAEQQRRRLRGTGENLSRLSGGKLRGQSIFKYEGNNHHSLLSAANRRPKPHAAHNAPQVQRRGAAHATPLASTDRRPGRPEPATSYDAKYTHHAHTPGRSTR